jgi:hypothetical protein
VKKFYNFDINDDYSSSKVPHLRELEHLERTYSFHFDPIFKEFLCLYNKVSFGKNSYIPLIDGQLLIRDTLLFSMIKEEIKMCFQSKVENNLQLYWPYWRSFFPFIEMDGDEPYMYIGLKEPFLHEIHIIDRDNYDEEGFIQTIKIANNFLGFLEKIKEH